MPTTSPQPFKRRVVPYVAIPRLSSALLSTYTSLRTLSPSPIEHDPNDVDLNPLHSDAPTPPPSNVSDIVSLSSPTPPPYDVSDIISLSSDDEETDPIHLILNQKGKKRARSTSLDKVVAHTSTAEWVGALEPSAGPSLAFFSASAPGPSRHQPTLQPTSRGPSSRSKRMRTNQAAPRRPASTDQDVSSREDVIDSLEAKVVRQKIEIAKLKGKCEGLTMSVSQFTRSATRFM
ncbi:hypothetical protein BDN72DRAFT_864664 [Pluteus cervinus]|uniref:Uncharacterized protein n=1 Tax=Pluteus cervinus TaxID=181527 RepID=A0ACD3A331_9AGAR|nr:hypothetical protein BDN72DRAFT_864664 [Pluteus cervinus]